MRRLALIVFTIVVAAAAQPAQAVDIELLDFESFQSEATAGETITVSWSGTVRDGDTGGPWTIGIYLSEDVVISPDDDVLLFRYTERYDTESGDVFFEAEEVTIPADTAAGTYSIGAFADDTFSVAETDENNNIERVTLSVTEGGGTTPSVDIDLDDFESFQSEAAAGETIRVRWDGTVDGGTTGGPWTVGIYLSEDGSISTDDVLLFRYTEQFDTGPDDVFLEDARVTIPAGTAAGTYTIGAFADDTFRVDESNEDNNIQSVSLTVTGSGDPDLSERYVFPAANLGGAGGSFFTTTVDIFNDGPTTVSYRVQMLPGDTDNSAAMESSLLTLEPGQTQRFDNVFGDLFGSAGEGIGGAAAVVSDSADLVVMSRTSNQVEEGTIGAALPGVSNTELIQAGERVTLVFLTENDDFRTNLGLINGVDAKIIVRFEAFDADGNILGTSSRVLPPFGVTQINRVLRSFRPIEAANIQIWTDTAGGAFTAYASILDQGTSDPTMVVPR